MVSQLDPKNALIFAVDVFNRSFMGLLLLLLQKPQAAATAGI